MKSIELHGITGKGLFALVDDEDYYFAMTWHWSLHNYGYAKRNKTIRRRSATMYVLTFLHREIANRAGINTDGIEIDHRNCNKLDNRRENLRPATRSQNCVNVGLKKSNTTGFKGVSFDKSRKCFVAHIRYGGRKHTLGRFNTAEDAYAAYCRAARLYHGEYARLR